MKKNKGEVSFNGKECSNPDTQGINFRQGRVSLNSRNIRKSYCLVLKMSRTLIFNLRHEKIHFSLIKVKKKPKFFLSHHQNINKTPWIKFLLKPLNKLPKSF